MHVSEHSLHCPLRTTLAVVPIDGSLVSEALSRPLLADAATGDRQNASMSGARAHGSARAAESLP
jgi:hypothetical protein